MHNNITFALLFGGGAKYGAGEDVTFIQDCIKAGLRVYKSPIIVSTMKQDSSTWFKGYDRKYYKDKGALLAANFPSISEVGVYIQAFKNRGGGYTFSELLRFYKEGVNEFKTNR